MIPHILKTDFNRMNNYLIIGGSSGIGKKLVELLAVEGNNVWATHNTQPAPNLGSNVQFQALDVMNNSLEIRDLPDVLHGVAYCPGSINLKPFHRLKPEDFVRDYELQVVGAIKVLQGVLPRLKAAEMASIVLFSTVAVQMGYTFHAQVSASKGAIEGLARALAAEWAPKIRVNVIAPSLTDTPLAGKLLSSPEKKENHAQRHPLKAVGSPEDIAEMANFILSKKSGWISGQIFHVDGGMSSIK